VPEAPSFTSVDPERRAGRFARRLASGAFVVTAELAPPDSADPAEIERRARPFAGCVDAINATDGSGANCHMSSIAVSALLVRLGLTPIMQMSCRDANRIAIQGHVVGAAALGIENILCITGDGVQAGDHPGAKPVFDLDSISLIDTVRTLRDDGRYLSGRTLSTPPRVSIGAVENPFAPPAGFRPARLMKKIAAGADFFQTQYCFDVPALRRFMTELGDLGFAGQAHILAGVGPLASARAARWMRRHVPGVHIPEAVIERLAGAADERAEGIRICVETIREIATIEGISGVHVMAYRQEERVPEIVAASGIRDMPRRAV